jgi:hypothetical protein
VKLEEREREREREEKKTILKIKFTRFEGWD